MSHISLRTVRVLGALALVTALAPLAAEQPALSEGQLAQQAASDGGDPAQTGAGAGQGMFLAVLMGVMLLMIVLSFRSSRKEKAKRQEMINQLAIGKRVATIGGIVGTVSRLGDETIDLQTGDTLMEISRGAVNRLLEDGDKVPDPHERA